MTPIRAALALLASLSFAATSALADAPKADVAKSADHPVLKRFTGSVLAGYAQQDWDQRTFPDARGVAKDDDKFDHVRWVPGLGGTPLLAGHAVAVAECVVRDDLDVGDHAVVTGLVEAGSPPESTSEPLLYFRRAYRGAGPSS